MEFARSGVTLNHQIPKFLDCLKIRRHSSPVKSGGNALKFAGGQSSGLIWLQASASIGCEDCGPLCGMALYAA
jgi:hypothetical protein